MAKTKIKDKIRQAAQTATQTAANKAAQVASQKKQEATKNQKAQRVRESAANVAKKTGAKAQKAAANKANNKPAKTTGIKAIKQATERKIGKVAPQMSARLDEKLDTTKKRNELLRITRRTEAMKANERYLDETYGVKTPWPSYMSRPPKRELTAEENAEITRLQQNIEDLRVPMKNGGTIRNANGVMWGVGGPTTWEQVGPGGVKWHNEQVANLQAQIDAIKARANDAPATQRDYSLRHKTPLDVLEAAGWTRLWTGMTPEQIAKELRDTVPKEEKNPVDTIRDTTQSAVDHLLAASKRKQTNAQTLSRHDNKLGQDARQQIKAAKQAFDEAAEKGDRAGMTKAHRRAEEIRRTLGGYSGGVTGAEYITPELTAEERAGLNKEGQKQLRAAKLGWKNSWNDTDRAKYAALGQEIRENPDFQSENYKGAYHQEDAHGRMVYNGNKEEREKEAEQALATLQAIGYGTAGAFASLPEVTKRALQADAARNQDRLQALSDIRGGGDVNISEPEQRRTPQEILADLYRNDYYQNASPFLKAQKLARAMKEIHDEIPAGQRLLQKSEEYREKATEGQAGLEKYLTQAIITGGEMIPGLLATAATGGAAAPGLAVMGAQAAGREMGDLSRRGVDPVEAFERGVVSGAIEAGTEALPLKNLVRIGKGEGASFAKNMLTQALEEVGTEEASELLQYGADRNLFKDPTASLTAQDLKDTAVISLLTSLGMSGGAGMLSTRRAGRNQNTNQAERDQRATAALDQITPTVEALAQQEATIHEQVEAWKDRASELLDRLTFTDQDPTWHKHLLGELTQHQAQGEQLRQQLVGLEMQKQQRNQVEQRKAEEARREEERQQAELARQETERAQAALAALQLQQTQQAQQEPQEQQKQPEQAALPLRITNPEPEQTDEPAEPLGIAEAEPATPPLEYASEAAGSPQNGFIEQQAREQPDRQEAAEGQETAPQDLQTFPVTERQEEPETRAVPYEQQQAPAQTQDPFAQMTSKTAQTLMNAGMTPDQIRSNLAEMARNGQLSHIPYTDEAATAKASRTIDEVGFQRAKEDWLSTVRSGKMNKDLTTMGITLYNQAANSGNIVEAMDLATELIEYGRTAGQVLQAVNVINRLGPTGQLYALSRSLERLEDKTRAQYNLDRDQWAGLSIPPDLAQQYAEAQTDEERAAVELTIKKELAKQLPNNWKVKMEAWRYLAMLGNVRTQGRNLLGNLGFQPVRIAKNMIGAGLERIAGIDQSERTKSPQFKAFSSADRARYRAGLSDYDTVESIIMGNGKYNDNFSDIEQYQPVFTSDNKAVNALLKPIEGWRRATNWGLEAGDAFFARRTYADSLANVLKARGITAEEYTSEDFPQEQRDEIRGIAIKEAQKATYRDINQFSEMVGGLGRRTDTTARKVSHYLIEGLLPFKKTPANVLVRGVEYSPAGIFKGIADMSTKVRRGEMSAAEALDELASGLTGTGLLGLGYLLAKFGIVTPGEDDDDAQAAFDQLRGKQSYAMNLPGGYNVTLDWLAPEAIPLFMGVELHEGIRSIRAGEKGKDVAWDFIRRISDPVLDMSMLQSVNDLLDNLSYADNKFMSVISTLATSYLTQHIPTLFGQVERSLEDRRYSTWIDKDSWVPSEIQYLLGKTMNKLPGEYHQREYLNAWGEPEMTGQNVLTRALSNMLSPGYIKKAGGGEVEDELQRLYDAGFNVFPTIEKTSTKINGEPVTAEQFNLLQGTKGQLMKDLYSQTIGTQEYKDLPDADKAKVLEQLKNYARDMGQVAAGRPKDTLDNWEKNTDDLSKTTGIGVAALIEASGMAQAINADENETPLNKILRFTDYMDKKGYTEEQQAAVRDAYFTSNAETRGLLETIKSGAVSKETAERFIEEGKKFDTNENGLDQDEKIATLKSMGLSHEESKALFEAGAARNEDGTAKTTYESKLESAKKAEEKAAKYAAVPAEKLTLFEEAAKTQNQGSGRWSYDDLYYTAMSVDATDAEREAWVNATKPSNYKGWQQIKKMKHGAR